jgi:hypothetical protein
MVPRPSRSTDLQIVLVVRILHVLPLTSIMKPTSSAEYGVFDGAR